MLFALPAPTRSTRVPAPAGAGTNISEWRGELVEDRQRLLWKPLLVDRLIRATPVKVSDPGVQERPQVVVVCPGCHGHADGRRRARVVDDLDAQAWVCVGVL